MIELRHALRRLLRAPRISLTIVATLAVGIGATTAIFSVVNGILIEPLPYAESDRLVELVHASSRAGSDEIEASEAVYFTYSEHNETFESVALWSTGTQSVTAPGEPEEVASLEATHELLPTLRVEPALGRTFTASDDEPDAAGTVMLSHGYWQRRFGGAEAALGETLIVDGEPHTIIGVLPRAFAFPSEPPEIVTPMQPERAIAFLGNFGPRGLARLEDGVTIAEANADVERMIPVMMETFPPPPGASREMIESLGLAPNLMRLKARVVGDLDETLWLLMGTLATLLVIACTNVANLQLVRAEARGRDFAIQSALGAKPRTIAAGLVLESLILALAGGVAGLALARLALPALLQLAGEHLPGVLEVAIDPAVLVFALAVSLGSGLVLGLIPAARHAAPRVVTASDAGDRSRSVSRDGHLTQNTLVVAQVALALVLLVASGLMARTYVSLHDVDPGFTSPERIQTVSLTIPEASVPAFDAVVRRFERLQSRLATIAGVESAGFISELPFTPGPNGPFFVEDDPPSAGVAPVSRAFRYTSPGLFATLGTPLVAGRGFEWSDHRGSAPSAIVSERMARAEWGTPADAVGERIRRTPRDPWLEIVGVARDIHHAGLDQAAPETAYVTLNERMARWMSRDVAFVIRSDRVGTPGFLEDIRQAVWSVDASLPLAGVRTLGDLYTQSMARTSLTLLLLSITGGMALLLGLVGVYGVISYALTRRAREIGIRVALGARDGQLRRMFLGRGLVPVTIGTAVGLCGAAALTRLMASQLFGVTAIDPATYAAVALTLIGTALLAAYLPLRRLTRVDPMQALRAE